MCVFIFSNVKFASCVYLDSGLFFEQSKHMKMSPWALDNTIGHFHFVPCIFHFHYLIN